MTRSPSSPGATSPEPAADIIRRGIATGTPSFGAYVLASRTIGPAAGRSVAYVSIVTTQLAQTVDLGQAEGGLAARVLGAVGGSLAVVGVTLAVPFLREFLGLAPAPLSGVLIAGGTAALAIVLSRGLRVERFAARGDQPTSRGSGNRIGTAIAAALPNARLWGRNTGAGSWSEELRRRGELLPASRSTALCRRADAGRGVARGPRRCAGRW